jgi:hypothetical protein
MKAELRRADVMDALGVSDRILRSLCGDEEGRGGKSWRRWTCDEVAVIAVHAALARTGVPHATAREIAADVVPRLKDDGGAFRRDWLVVTMNADKWFWTLFPKLEEPHACPLAFVQCRPADIIADVWAKLYPARTHELPAASWPIEQTDEPAVIDLDAFSRISARAAEVGLSALDDDELLTLHNSYAFVRNGCLLEIHRRGLLGSSAEKRRKMN